ncbi:MAG: NAD+ synthase [Opitutales bacterium]|nr:NAD+ synthase [Opitutales bacterium]
MKIGIAQINTIVGDLSGNKERILDAYRQLCAQGAELIVFPELVICGYPPRDLIFKSRFIKDTETTLQEIASQTGNTPALIGFVEKNPSALGRTAYNSVAFCAEGKVREIARKSLLPTYDVFDEDRYFESAEMPTVIEYAGKRIAITVCEDIWTTSEISTGKYYKKIPLEALSKESPDLMLNISASPWHYGKSAFRLEHVVSKASKLLNCPVVYCNAVGGNDELLFDGHSLAVQANGDPIAAMEGFKEQLKVVSLEDKTRDIAESYNAPTIEQIESALIMGLRDYAHKTGFKKAVLGLSGGIDSALTAAIAAKALGKENVIGVSLPSAISSQHSKDDAADLAKKLGIRYETLPIASIVSSAESTLGEIFAGLPADVTEENIQARARGLLLMAISNKFGALLLTTGNKSELSVGYCTLYGDMCGGLAVISDLPKTKVFELCRWINRAEEVIPWNTIEKPPSAELRPDQKDEDSLPPYDILDGILERYVELGQSRDEIVAAGYSAEVVYDVARKVDLNEYKRKQAAPGLKVSPLAFGVGRRIPIVQKYIS